MKALIRRLISRYGTDIEILTEAEKSTKARGFLQLVTSKSWQNMERMIPDGGEVPRGQYLFIGLPDSGVRAANILLADGRVFIVRRADAILYRNESLFIWGLCVKGGEADPWTESSDSSFPS